jgi:serine/threonine-protein kinase
MTTNRGESLGRYEVLDAIASGGMGVVHRAVMRGPAGFRKHVALKRLRPHLIGDPAAVARLLREARLGACVRHPNVVAVLDSGVDDEPYLVMDLVEGRTLGALLRELGGLQEKAPIPVAVAVIGDLLAALHAAHEATDEEGRPLMLVHRDVSPQNVLVGSDGITRLIDFGIARALDVTQTHGRIKGKLGYVAPEQIDGATTRRTDIYATSVVLWETLAGANFVPRSSPSFRAALAAARREPPSVLRPGLSPALDAVVLRGLSLDPEDRFPDAATMQRDLEAASPRASNAEVRAWLLGSKRKPSVEAMFAGEEEDATAGDDDETTASVEQATRVNAAPSPPRRRRPVAGALIAVAVVVAMLVTIGLWRARSRDVSSPAPGRASKTLASTPPSPLTAVAPSAASKEEEPVQIARPATSMSSSTPPRPRSPAGRGRQDCMPPWVILPDGRKHFREECFQAGSR